MGDKLIIPKKEKKGKKIISKTLGDCNHDYDYHDYNHDFNLFLLFFSNFRDF